MIETYKFGKAFGPVMSFSGIVIFVVGLATTIFYSLGGIIFILIGALLAFTNSSTSIDFEHKRARFTFNLFGIFRIGKWKKLQENMKIGFRKSNNVYRTYSRSNRTVDVSQEDKKIYLVDNKGKEILPLKKISDDDNIKEQLKEMSEKLQLSIIR